MKSKIKYLIPVGSIIFGVVFAVVSLKNYELFNATKGPMSGFLPVVVGALLAAVGVADMIQAKHYEDQEFSRDNWLIVIGVLLVIAGHYIWGILPGAFLLAFLWLKVKEKYSWKTTVLTMIFIVVLVIGVFDMWLDIPFEYGMLGEMLKK